MKEISKEKLEKRIEALENEVAELREEVQPLVKMFEAFQKHKRSTIRS